MEAKYPEITLGATVCEKLKAIYFDQQVWQECYKDVASQFSILKANMRKFYTDKTIIEILQELGRYSSDDIREAITHQGNEISSPG